MASEFSAIDYAKELQSAGLPEKQATIQKLRSELKRIRGIMGISVGLQIGMLLKLIFP